MTKKQLCCGQCGAALEPNEVWTIPAGPLCWPCFIDIIEKALALAWPATPGQTDRAPRQ